MNYLINFSLIGLICKKGALTTEEKLENEQMIISKQNKTTILKKTHMLKWNNKIGKWTKRMWNDNENVWKNTFNEKRNLIS